LNEAAKLSFWRCLVSKSIRKVRVESPPAGLEIIGARSLGETIEVTFSKK
jgi:hypothetical protein